MPVQEVPPRFGDILCSRYNFIIFCVCVEMMLNRTEIFIWESCKIKSIIFKTFDFLEICFDAMILYFLFWFPHICYWNEIFLFQLLFLFCNDVDDGDDDDNLMIVDDDLVRQVVPIDVVVR